MNAFLEGAIAGYGIAIPVGAIAVLIMDTAMRRGLAAGMAAGAGAAAADLLYAGLAAIAGEALGRFFSPFAAELRILSGVVLVGIGAFGLWRGWRNRQQEAADPPQGGVLRVFVQFLGLTLLNPLTITYFGALILGRPAGVLSGPLARLLFVAGAGLASLSWQWVLALFGAFANRRLSPGHQGLTSLAGNLIVVALGANILVRAIGS